MEEFLAIFGQIPLSTVILLVGAFAFMYTSYQKFTKRIIDAHEKDKEHEEVLKEVVDKVSQIPAYRQESIEAQQELRNSISKLTVVVEKLGKRQDEIETERNSYKLTELREKLMTMHQMYTNPDRNPMLAWTELEKESFDAIFTDYEKLGGNGFMHTNVRPDVDKLRVIPMYAAADIVALMQSRS